MSHSSVGKSVSAAESIDGNSSHTVDAATDVDGGLLVPSDDEPVLSTCDIDMNSSG